MSWRWDYPSQNYHIALLYGTTIYTLWYKFVAMLCCDLSRRSSYLSRINWTTYFCCIVLCLFPALCNVSFFIEGKGYNVFCAAATNMSLSIQKWFYSHLQNIFCIQHLQLDLEMGPPRRYQPRPSRRGCHGSSRQNFGLLTQKWRSPRGSTLAYDRPPPQSYIMYRHTGGRFSSCRSLWRHKYGPKFTT